MSTDVLVDEYTVLHVLRVKGLASAESVAACVGAPVAVVEPLLQQSVGDQLVKRREGRLSGYMLTPAGRARHANLRCGAVTDEVSSHLCAAYDQFLGVNNAFKQLTTDWQLREPGADTAPLLARLERLDTDVEAVIATASDAVPRFAHYRARFAAAFDRLRQGDDSAFARPMSDSYHDVWMELHEDLLSTLDRERSDADE